MILLPVVLTASAGRLTLLEETFQLAPGELRGLNLALRQRPAVIDIEFRSMRDKAPVSVGLQAPQGAAGAPPRRFVRLVRDQVSGSIRYPARLPGDYRVVVENPRRNGPAATVNLRVELGFEEAGTLRSETLPPERRRLVVTLSLLFLLLVALIGGRALREAIERQRRGGQFPPF